MEDICLQRFRQFMVNIPNGDVSADNRSELVGLLANCWDRFTGSDMERMRANKLARMEDIAWHSPSLSFSIERHGGTVLGSTRATLQRWVVDLDQGVAECHVEGYRQIYPRSASVDVEPIADELVKLIVKGKQDERLQWTKGGNLRVLSGRIFPDSSAPRETLEGRRGRLGGAISKRLLPLGWQSNCGWWSRKKV